MKKKFAFLFLMTILLSGCAGANPLSDTSWELIAYGPVNNPIPAEPGIFATISFSADSNLKGNVGCNSFSGPYQVSGNDLTTGPLMATLMACESARMEQESAVLMLLNGRLAFESDGESLTITSEDGNSELYLLSTEN